MQASVVRPAENSVRVYLQTMMLAIASLVFAAIGLYLVGLYWDYAPAYNSQLSFSVAGRVGFDVYGCVIPLAAGLVSTAVYLAKFSAKRFAVCFCISLMLAFLFSRMTDVGLIGHPMVFALFAGSAAAILTLFSRSLLGTKSISPSILSALGSVPLSLVITDLAYAPFFAGSTVGGSGLVDGILISTLYAPIWAALVATIVMMVIQTAAFLRNYTSQK